MVVVFSGCTLSPYPQPWTAYIAVSRNSRVPPWWAGFPPPTLSYISCSCAAKRRHGASSHHPTFQISFYQAASCSHPSPLLHLGFMEVCFIVWCSSQPGQQHFLNQRITCYRKVTEVEQEKSWAWHGTGSPPGWGRLWFFPAAAKCKDCQVFSNINTWAGSASWGAWWGASRWVTVRCRSPGWWGKLQQAWVPSRLLGIILGRRSGLWAGAGRAFEDINEISCIYWAYKNTFWKA